MVLFFYYYCILLCAENSHIGGLVNNEDVLIKKHILNFMGNICVIRQFSIKKWI